MKSMYFVIKTVNDEKKFAKTSDEMTSEEFLGTFVDMAKEAYPITEEEYHACVGKEKTSYSNATNGGHKSSCNAEWSKGRRIT